MWYKYSSPNGGTAERNTISKGDIRTLLGKGCEVEKVMRFLREMLGMFEEMLRFKMTGE